MKFKKMTALALSFAVAMSCFAGCGKDTSENEEKPMEMRDISSIELIKEMNIGWNLGNTLDATGGSGLSSETSWGNPITTQEMIDGVAQKGFNVLRLPVTWQGHFGEGPDYTIDEEWLARVKEIVDYAYANDMFVILNMHHEDWHFPSEENYEVASATLKALWKQIAEYFKNYDEHLIFEGMNEPRKKGTKVEWNAGDAEGREIVNRLNKDFMETVRSTGGNNPLRHLMIPGYAASNDSVALDAIELPDDDKVIVSVHAYTPYSFALQEGGKTTFDPENSADYRSIENLMYDLNERYISQGRAVIIGEFGARSKDNLEARTAWAECYTKYATQYGIPCVVWDNNASIGGGELFGLYNRSRNEWYFPEVVDAFMRGIELGKATE